MVMDGAPPVFEQIFRNARFAQGGNAFFEGKVTGNPRPELSWTREGRPLSPGTLFVYLFYWFHFLYIAVHVILLDFGLV